MVELRGITWDHTRGYLPMVATAQRFSELHPDVDIRWVKRSLLEFAESPMEELAARFDLLVIDHPWMGLAAESGVLLPLDRHLPPEFLSGQAQNSVGLSHPSYSFAGHQWALAIDAAAPICGYRPDLLEKAGARVPQSWSELLELARRGLVIVPGDPVDSLMHFYMLCTGLGYEPFSGEDQRIPADCGATALKMLRELLQLVPPECANWTPPTVWEALSSGDSAALCPFAYGYSNYARRGYARHTLEFDGLIRIDGHGRCRSTLGGAGLAVSSKCLHPELAMEYCAFVASPECQKGLYFESGGQPGHRSAWLDDEVNRSSGDFFKRTLASLDEAYLRPRWAGYTDFQRAGGLLLDRYLWGHSRQDPRQVVDQLNEMLSAKETI